MCKYCERRTDMKLGWNQPELPWHDNQDITRNISGNMIHTNDTVGVIHDYQTASPVLILKDKSASVLMMMALVRSTFQSNSVRNAEENLDDSRDCGKLAKERE